MAIKGIAALLVSDQYALDALAVRKAQGKKPGGLRPNPQPKKKEFARKPRVK
jgi:hypothetical protein